MSFIIPISRITVYGIFLFLEAITMVVQETNHICRFVPNANPNQLRDFHQEIFINPIQQDQGIETRQEKTDGPLR